MIEKQFIRDNVSWDDFRCSMEKSSYKLVYNQKPQPPFIVVYDSKPELVKVLTFVTKDDFP